MKSDPATVEFLFAKPVSERGFPVTKHAYFYSLVLACLFSSFHSGGAFADKCTYRGKPLNREVDTETASISGTVQCRYGSESVPSTEYLYEKGKVLKVREFYRNSGKLKGEYGVVNPKRGTSDQSNLEGLCKEWSDTGILINESFYNKGWNVWRRTFDEQGDLRSFTDYGSSDSEKKTYIEYTAGGKLENLYCGTAFSNEAHRKLCGFSGKSVVPLYNRAGKVERRLTLVDGKIVETVQVDADTGKELASNVKASGKSPGLKTERFANGNVKQETRYDDAGNLVGVQKEFAESGQLIREARFEDGFMTEERLFYLNGQKKKETLREKSGKAGEAAIVTSRSYWDNGKLEHEGAYKERTRHSSFGWWSKGLEEFGKHTHWYETGAVALESEWGEGKRVGIWKAYGPDEERREDTYKEGVLVRTRKFNGKQMVLDEEYFSDGSRVKR